MLHEKFRWQNSLHNFVKRIHAHTYTIATCEQTRTAYFFQITPRFFFFKTAPKESLNPFFFLIKKRCSVVTTDTKQNHLIFRIHSAMVINSTRLCEAPYCSQRNSSPDQVWASAVHGFLPHPKLKLSLCQQSLSLKNISTKFIKMHPEMDTNGVGGTIKIKWLRKASEQLKDRTAEHIFL